MSGFKKSITGELGQLEGNEPFHIGDIKRFQIGEKEPCLNEDKEPCLNVDKEPCLNVDKDSCHNEAKKQSQYGPSLSDESHHDSLIKKIRDTSSKLRVEKILALIPEQISSVKEQARKIYACFKDINKNLEDIADEMTIVTDNLKSLDESEVAEVRENVDSVVMQVETDLLDIRNTGSIFDSAFQFLQRRLTRAFFQLELYEASKLLSREYERDSDDSYEDIEVYTDYSNDSDDGNPCRSVINSDEQKRNASAQRLREVTSELIELDILRNGSKGDEEDFYSTSGSRELSSPE